MYGKTNVLGIGLGQIGQALAERLQEKNLVRELIMRPGYVTIAMRGAEREAEVIKCGLRQLERRFPQCVQVEDKGHFSR